MNYLLIFCAVFSSLSFIAYAVSYFVSPHMKSEFERFNLEHLGLLIIILEILGALGLIVGLVFQPILLISSGGLSLLMLLGLITRIKSNDSFLISLPAIFYMLLNGYIFYLGVIG
jgi:hypothetical protein